jgi:hypothetical protein
VRSRRPTSSSRPVATARRCCPTGRAGRVPRRPGARLGLSQPGAVRRP